MSVTRLWLILVASASLVSGCGSSEDAQIVSAGDAFVLIGAKNADQTSPGTRHPAEVAMTGDCLGIGDTTIYWPYGTKVVDREPLTVDVPNLGPVALGDRLNGGVYNRVDQLPAGIDALPPGCPSFPAMTYFPRQAHP